MKTKQIITLLFILSISNIKAETKFKIQLSFNHPNDPTELLETVKKAKYIQKDGSAIYFFHKIFHSFYSAKSQHKKLVDKGFNNSQIKVFKDGKLIANDIAVVYIRKAKVRELLGEDKPTIYSNERNKKILTRKEFNQLYKNKLDKNRQKKALTSKLPINIKHPETAIKNEILIEKSIIELQSILDSSLTSNENQHLKNLIEVELKNKTLQAPIYRIKLIESENPLTHKTLDKIENVEGIIKVHEKRYSKVYTVDFFYSPIDAAKKIAIYENLGFKAKVVGDYKNIIISEHMANLIKSSISN